MSNKKNVLDALAEILGAVDNVTSAYKDVRGTDSEPAWVADLHDATSTARSVLSGVTGTQPPINIGDRVLVHVDDKIGWEPARVSRIYYNVKLEREATGGQYTSIRTQVSHANIMPVGEKGGAV